MTNTENVEGQSLPALLRTARADVIGLRNTLLRELTPGSIGSSHLSTALILSQVRAYGVALLKLTSLEDQVDQTSSSICGAVHGNAVDLADARREVLDRVARFRERIGN